MSHFVRFPIAGLKDCTPDERGRHLLFATVVTQVPDAKCTEPHCDCGEWSKQALVALSPITSAEQDYLDNAVAKVEAYYLIHKLTDAATNAGIKSTTFVSPAFFSPVPGPRSLGGKE